MHPHHNYYEGRATADLTPWMEYFIKTLAGVFAAAKDEALRHAGDNLPVEPEVLRHLDARARLVLSLFVRKDRITSAEGADILSLSERMARVLLKEWVDGGFLVVVEPSRRSRAYGLSAIHRQFIGNRRIQGRSMTTGQA